MVKEIESEVIENIPGPSKPLSQEVKKVEPRDDVSIIPAPKALDHVQTVPNEVLVAFYPFEFDKASLVWRQPRQHPLGLEDWSNFLSSKDRVMDQHALKKKMLYVSNLVLHRNSKESNDVVFQVNSRASSLQVGVSDTQKIRELTESFANIWKRKKRAQRKPEI